MPSTRPRPGSELSPVISKRSPRLFSTSACLPRTPWRIQFGKIFASAGADGPFGTVPVVSGAAAAGAAAAAITLFLSFWSRSTASAIRASFAFGSACARSMRSRRWATLATGLLGLRAVPSTYVWSADNAESSALGACASDAAALEEPGATYARNWLTPPAERDPTNDPSAAALASEAAIMARRSGRGGGASPFGVNLARSVRLGYVVQL